MNYSVKPLNHFLERKGLHKEKNLRMTRQRRVILEELQSKNNHPSADELYERVRVHLPRISLGTIYRNLEILCELEQIQKLSLSGSLKRYDGNPLKHYHIRCVRCNRVDDAPIAPMNQLEDEIYEATVFEIIGHNLEFVGFCPECSKKNRQT
ncbi:MAG: transcriptional repressor [Deltaproteobacteria bacterium]|nr:transcriptional repressor [Deltaproteobacteria bacterium]